MSAESGRAAVWRCLHSPDVPAGLCSAGALYSLTAGLCSAGALSSLTTATALRGKNLPNEK